MTNLIILMISYVAACAVPAMLVDSVGKPMSWAALVITSLIVFFAYAGWTYSALAREVQDDRLPSKCRTRFFARNLISFVLMVACVMGGVLITMSM